MITMDLMYIKGWAIPVDPRWLKTRYFQTGQIINGPHQRPAIRTFVCSTNLEEDDWHRPKIREVSIIQADKT